MVGSTPIRFRHSFLSLLLKDFWTTQKTLSSMRKKHKEWWSRFSIPLVCLDSLGLARGTQSHPQPTTSRSIISTTASSSIDTLKNNLEYRNYIENAWWDIIVIDECHNVAARATEQGRSRRARLAEKLAGRSDTLILLSATPHDGSARSFASPGEPSSTPPPSVTPMTTRQRTTATKGLVIRRFKRTLRTRLTGASRNGAPSD